VRHYVCASVRHYVCVSVNNRLFTYDQMFTKLLQQFDIHESLVPVLNRSDPPMFNSIQFNIYCIKYSNIYSNTVTKKNHEFSEEVNAK